MEGGREGTREGGREGAIEGWRRRDGGSGTFADERVGELAEEGLQQAADDVHVRPLSVLQIQLLCALKREHEESAIGL